MRVLLVDDDDMNRSAVKFFLEQAIQCDVCEATNGEEALALHKAEPVHLIVSDIKMPVMDGIELLRKVREIPDGGPEVILMTGFASVDTAVAALRLGAYDYIYKPIRFEVLSTVIRNWKEERSEQPSKTLSPVSKPLNITSQIISIPGYKSIGVYSNAMETAISLAFNYHGQRHTPVLIQGESGTGKEAIARLVHHGRGQVERPFIAINCPSVAPSLFESELFGYRPGAYTGAASQGGTGKVTLAEGGTLFLDEIGELPQTLQPKLLRLLEERTYYPVGDDRIHRADIHVVTATNRDLAKEVARGRFRLDLFHRLNTGIIQLSPLRDQKEAIIPLAHLFATRFCRQLEKTNPMSGDEDSVNRLRNYPWPGNIRELSNLVERAVLLGYAPETLLDGATGRRPSNEPGCVPLSIDSVVLPEAALDLGALVDHIVLESVRKFNGNKSQAARYLGISRGSLRKKYDRANS